MIQAFMAHTYEIDDAEKAIEDVKRQIDLGDLRKSSVGIITCHYEFVFSGVAAAICKALPFPVVGAISNLLGANGDRGNIALALTVLTADDARFATALSDTLTEDPDGSLARAYAEGAGDDGPPALILAYGGFLPQNVGDEYVDTLTRVSGGAPVFGTLAVDDTQTFENSFMLYNDGHYRDRMGLVLIYGNVAPQFFMASVSAGQSMMERPALITKAERHILKEVNGRSLRDFFADLGLTKASETSYAMASIPFMVDYGDGEPMGSKVFIGMTPEGYGIFAGAMPEGATMYMGVFDKTDVLDTTGEAAQRAAAAMESGGVVLAYSCVSRYMSIGTDAFAEMDVVFRAMEGKPCMMAYSGGELCPTRADSERVANRFHNNAFIACVF